MTQKVLNVPYAIDLGNGFTKRRGLNEVITEPSVIAEVPDYFTVGESFDVFSINNSLPYYIGDDVVKSKITAVPALGEDDIDRYESDEFKQLLFGFIARDFKKSVTIPQLITGLPVNHFKAKADRLKEIIKGKKVISVNGEEIVIEILDVQVLPQPIGTYMHLVNLEKINADNELTLIVDGGHGTVDITEMRGQSIIGRAGAPIGVRNAYLSIFNFLIDKYGESRQLSIAAMPSIMKDGLKYDKQVINVPALKEVKDILVKHFDDVFRFIRENQFDLKSYENVVFTGGMALLHKELIEEKERNNFVVLDNSQEANVLGYYEFGKAVLESEKNSTVRG